MPDKPASPAPQNPAAKPDQQNEGEGNRTAARAYNKAATDFAQSGKVEKAAESAAKASPAEQEEARRAEETGRRHSHGEDPTVKR
jgi:hypothetical protein